MFDLQLVSLLVKLTMQSIMQCNSYHSLQLVNLVIVYK